jgi:toxin ParE1/3/4
VPAKYRVEITRAAEADVAGIWRFIARESEAAADEFIHQLERGTSTLERFPARCPPIPENVVLGTEYRHLLVGDYRTIFRIGGRSVFVLRIVHGAKLLDDSMFGTA